MDRNTAIKHGEKMQAFLNDPAVQETYLGRVRAHALADEIVQGTYWENGRGCAVGCTIHSGKHAAYEKLLGIPQELAYLQGPPESCASATTC